MYPHFVYVRCKMAPIHKKNFPLFTEYLHHFSTNKKKPCKSHGDFLAIHFFARVHTLRTYWLVYHIVTFQIKEDTLSVLFLCPTH